MSRSTRSAALFWVLLAAALAMTGLVAPPAAAQAADTTFDYAAPDQVETLSQPDYPKTVTEAIRVPVTGANEPLKEAELYVEVTLPDPEEYGDGPWPTILEASPYHGTLADRIGTRIFPDPRDDKGAMIGLTGYFAQRGYAVVMVDLRGTGRSSGCLDHLGPNDASDLKEIIEWAADQSWSNGRVGMTGHSYVGSTPKVAAAQDPEGLVTIAPSAGLASMYDHQFQYGVPYNLQWAGPIFAYEQLSVERHAPGGDAFGEPLPPACGLYHSAITAGEGQVTGQYDNNLPQEWHARRDYRSEVIPADMPVFMIHGVNDNAARIPAAEWFFGNREDARDKVWIGQWDHGSAANTTCAQGHPNCRFEQWQYALHAWFDEHLAQRDVDTGPVVEAFLNGEKVNVSDAWDASPVLTSVFPDADGKLLLDGPPAADGSVAFTSTPVEGGSTEFVSAPVTADTLFLGLPQMKLVASLTGANQVFHLVTTLYSESPDGERTPMNYCAIQPSLRDNPDDSRPVELKPIVPGEEMELDPQCFTMAHQIPEGHKLVLSVGTGSVHHISGLANPFLPDEVTIFTGATKSAYDLPMDIAFDLIDDVDIPIPGLPEFEIPDAPAQPPQCDTVTVPGTGGEVQAEGFNVVYYEFDSKPQYGNAKFDVVATPASQADVDMFLQRKQQDGTWSEDLGASGGGSSSLDGEKLSYTQPVPGTYRVGIVNWAGPPLLDVEVCVTFFDAEGNAGVKDDEDDREPTDPDGGGGVDPTDEDGGDGDGDGGGVGDDADDRAPTLPATGGGAAALGLTLLAGGGLLVRRRRRP